MIVVSHKVDDADENDAGSGITAEAPPIQPTLAEIAANKQPEPTI